MSDVRLAPEKGSKKGLWLKRFLVLSVGVAIIGVTGAGLVGMNAAAPRPEEKEDLVEALPVLTTTAKAEEVKLKVRSQGEVMARSEVNLASEVSGRISYVSPAFLTGGSFSRGDVLVRIDPKEYELRVVQARANVAQARTTLKREQSEADIAKLNAQELGIDQVSDLALREPQVAEAEARLASTIAALSEAELALERTKIRAPFTGRVKAKSVDVGAYITPGGMLGSIYSSDVVEVPLALTDADLAALDLGIGFEANASKPGPEVVLSAVVAGRSYDWKGRITRTDSRFDPDTRVLFAYAEVKDPYGAGASDGTPLANGLYVSAEIDGRPIENAVTIPRTALRGKDKVYVVSDVDTLEIRQVGVASSDRTEAVITEGLQAGETVVTSPVKSPATGMKVQPVDEADARRGQGAVVASAANTQLQE